LQAIAQLPAAQLGDPLFDEQAVPHVPQLARESVRFVSHPVVRAFPSQSPHPALQLIAQSPAAQFGVPCAAEHAAPHPPQFSGSVDSSVQAPPQLTRAKPHRPPGTHVPATHAPLQQSSGCMHGTAPVEQQALTHRSPRQRPLQHSPDEPHDIASASQADAHQSEGKRSRGPEVASPAGPSPSALVAVTRYQNIPQSSGRSTNSWPVVGVKNGGRLQESAVGVTRSTRLPRFP